MSAGKISELVDDKALNQLDQLLQKLGIVKSEMVDSIAVANQFNNAISGSKSIPDLNANIQKTAESLDNVAQKQQAVTQVQQQATEATKALVEATKSKALADVDAQKVLAQIGGTLDANIKLLVQQKLELKNVTSQQKELTKEVVSSTNSQNAQQAKMAELTKQQLALKDSISQLTLQIKQQVKETNSAESSQDAMLARLNQLRKAYNSLSAEERNNVETGGALLNNIKQLATETTAINEAQGKYNDSVGMYEEKIKSAIASYIPYGRQIVNAVDLLKDAKSGTEGATTATSALGAEFAGFTIGAFAVGMAAATYYLQQFRDTGQKVDQFMAGLKAQFANFGKNFIEVIQNKPGANIWNNFKESFYSGIDTQAEIQQVKNLNEVNDVQIQKMQGQADQYRALAKDVKLSAEERVSYLKQAQKVENDVIDQQTTNAQQNIQAGIDLSNKYKTLTADQQRLLASGTSASVQYANDLAQTGKLTEAGYEMLLEGYQRQTQAMNAANMKLIRQQNDEARIENKEAKQINTDALELQRYKLEGEKETAKLILDDEKQSYEARLAALKIYVDRSKSIIENQRQSANSAPNISKTKKAANNQNALNQSASVDIFNEDQAQKIQKEAIKELVDYYKQIHQETTDDLQLNLAQQLADIKSNEANKEATLLENYQKGKINEKQYNEDLKIIRDEANVARIKAQRDTDQAIADIDQALYTGAALTGLPIAGGVTKSTLTKDQIKVKNDNADLTGATSQLNSDTGKGKKLDDKSLSKDQQIDILAIQDLEKLQDDASKIMQENYQHEIELLDQKKQAIADAANEEIKGVQNSILSSKEKAREEAIIKAQADAQQRQITDQQNKIKEQEAKYNRALAIAQIIENTSIAAIKAPAELGPILGLAAVPVIVALGAAQLAATLAVPLPKFEKGGKVKRDGPIITGEAGTELRIDPTGQMSFTQPFENVTYAKAGTLIISNKELMRIVGRPEPIAYVSNTTVDLRKLEKLSAQNIDLQKQILQTRQPRRERKLPSGYEVYKTMYNR